MSARVPAIAVLVAGVLGCSVAGPTPDAGTDAREGDAGTPLPVMVVAEGIDLVDPRLPHAPRPPDWSCLHVGTPEPPGPFATRTMRVVVWRQNVSLEGACLRAYAGDIAPGDVCGATDPRTDASGTVAIQAPITGPTTLRLFAIDGASSATTFADSTYFALGPTSPGVIAVPAATVTEATLHLGLGARAHGAAVVGVVVDDCSNVGVYGATLRLAREDGTEITAEDGARVVYSDGESHFDATPRWTHVDGIAGMMNVPVSSPGEVAFAEIYGRLDEASPPTLVACVRLQLVPDGNALAVPIPIVGAGEPPCPVLP